VRFASVYKNFREAKDFEEILGKLAEGEGDEDLPPPPKKKRVQTEQ
jgi:transcriptional repressor NrdR